MANADAFAALQKKDPQAAAWFSPTKEEKPGNPNDPWGTGENTMTTTEAAKQAPAAAPTVKPGVYDDTDGVYQYQLMDDGNIKILRSRRGGAGTIVEADTVAHDAIMKNIMSGGAKPAKVKGAAYDHKQSMSVPAPKSAAKPKITTEADAEEALMPYGDTSYEDAMEGPTISAYEAKESPQKDYNNADIDAARRALVAFYAFSTKDAERMVNKMVNDPDPRESSKVRRLAKEYQYQQR